MRCCEPGWRKPPGRPADLGRGSASVRPEQKQGTETLETLSRETAQTPRRGRAGYTLIELLILISVLGILAGILLPTLNPSVHDQIRSVGRIMSADLAYARDLSIANGSTYELSFDLPNEQYVLRHSGGNSALDTLPHNPFHATTDPPYKHTYSLEHLPHAGPDVQLHSMYVDTDPPAAVDTLEYGPLGETTRAEPTVIWLRCGAGDSLCYLPLRVDPITGLADVGPVQATRPPTPTSGISSTP